MRAYWYELLAVVFVLLGMILFSTFERAEGGNENAEPNAQMVSLK